MATANLSTLRSWGDATGATVVSVAPDPVESVEHPAISTDAAAMATHSE